MYTLKAHVCNPNTWNAKAGGSLSLERSAWEGEHQLCTVNILKDFKYSLYNNSFIIPRTFNRQYCVEGEH